MIYEPCRLTRCTLPGDSTTRPQQSIRGSTRAWYLACAAALSACGGGGGGDTTADSTPSSRIDIAAVGVYSATVTGGPLPIFQDLVISPTGRAAIYYSDAFEGSRGFVDVALDGSGGAFKASLTDVARAGVYQGAATGTYRAGSGVAATVTYPGQTYSIEYQFRAYPTDPAGPASALGTWNSMDERGSAQTLTVSGARTGTFSVAYGSTCTVAGTTTFADANSNAYQVATLAGTATGTGCRFGTGPVSGLLLVRGPGTTNPSIVGHLIRQDRTDGFMLKSYRCRDGSSRPLTPVFSC